MKYLLLIRHAKSSWKNPNLLDLQRPLNKRGKRESLQLGKLLKDLELIPDQIISSHAVRALKTTKNINKKLKLSANKITINEKIYTDNFQDILKVIHSSMSNVNLLCIVGHSPSFLDLGNHLTGTKIEKIVTCGILLVELKEKSWKLKSTNKNKIILFL
jgi:phosphohistidine phosphatase